MEKLARSKKQQWKDFDRNKAMPDVKKMVSKHGRATIIWCLNQLKEYEKKTKQLQELKKEAEKLERQLKIKK